MTTPFPEVSTEKLQEAIDFLEADLMAEGYPRPNPVLSGPSQWCDDAYLHHFS